MLKKRVTDVKDSDNGVKGSEKKAQSISRNRKAGKLSGIQQRIQKPIVRLLVIAMVAMGVLSSVLIFIGTMNTLKQTLKESARIGAQSISNELNDYAHIAYETGCNTTLSSIYASTDEKLAVLQQKVENYNIIGCDYFDARKSHEAAEDVTGEEFYQRAMAGEIYISEPEMDDETGKVSFFISAPLWRDGQADSEVVGVIKMITDTKLLTNMVKSINISRNSNAFILDGNGVYVASYDERSVKERHSALTDSSEKGLASIAEKMTAGEQGIDSCITHGVYRYIAYAPIDGTNGWSLAIGAAANDFSFYTLLGIAVIMISVFLGILFAIRITGRVSAKIVAPIKLCDERLQLLAQGDLHSDIPVVLENDETGSLASSTGRIVTSMKTMIEDINYLLDCMANNNFNIKSGAEESYIGDFRDIILSLRKINHSLSGTLADINGSANQVAQAADQMSLGAQNLAEGATDQSAAVEELLATVESLTVQMKDNAEQSKKTSSHVMEISDGAARGNEQIHAMTIAMDNISEKSNQIRNIITVIEDIASQTNLLSLNASIEAARAGEAGRGFAVVAGEIRHLAEQSEQAVVDTRVLIEAALNEVTRGHLTVKDTSDTLLSMIHGLEEIAASVLEASRTSLSQTESMVQVRGGIEQISNVVENNSATAEETSATSEELAAQAEQLNDLVAQFIFKD